MRTTKNLPESASLLGTRTIGRYSRWLYYSISRFGQRIRIPLAAVSLLGLRIESSCFYVNHERVGQETGCPPLLHPTLAVPDTSVSITTHKRGWTKPRRGML